MQSSTKRKNIVACGNGMLTFFGIIRVHKVNVFIFQISRKKVTFQVFIWHSNPCVELW